jgi:uncharacterized membrane protein
MKKYLVVLAAMAFVIAMVSGAYAANNTTQTVTATATVSTICKNGTNGTLAFGTIDPGGSSAVTASSSGLTYMCSNGTTFNISAISGATDSISGTCGAFTGHMVSTVASTDKMSYDIACNAGPYKGTGFAAGVDVVLNGTVTVAEYQNAVPHADYNDLMTVTIAY